MSSFTAKYYFEDDGTNPGKGNDGTQRNIQAELKFTETVKRPALHLTFPFHGIDSYNLYAVWEGSMAVIGEKRTATAQFDVSWGDVSFWVNGKLVDKWNNTSKKVAFDLNPGENTLRVDSSAVKV